MAKPRDAALDAMRGIGIVLMVLGHSGFAGSDFIYLFHMALFFMLSGYFFHMSGEGAALRRFCLRRVAALWLPFVLANTAFTVCNNLFLRLNILTGDPRILELPGNQVTGPVTLRDIVGRTAHWCVFDGGTQLGGALWFVQALFQISLLYALVEFLLRRVFPRRDTLLPFGSVGLAGNQYPGWLFLLVASAAGWVLVYECARLAAALPVLAAALAALGRAAMPVVILHFLSFKLVSWLGLQVLGGEPYLLAAFPTLYTGGAWWLAYTAAGLALPLLAYQPYRLAKRRILQKQGRA